MQLLSCQPVAFLLILLVIEWHRGETRSHQGRRTVQEDRNERGDYIKAAEQLGKQEWRRNTERQQIRNGGGWLRVLRAADAGWN